MRSSPRLRRLRKLKLKHEHELKKHGGTPKCPIDQEKSPHEDKMSAGIMHPIPGVLNGRKGLDLIVTIDMKIHTKMKDTGHVQDRERQLMALVGEAFDGLPILVIPFSSTLLL
jgi:hypothetical protein